MDDFLPEWRELCDKMNRLRIDNARLEQWIDDAQAGMYINCVYCGHRYGPEDEVPVTMADALYEHITQCPEHPLSRCKAENARLREVLGQVPPFLKELMQFASDLFGGESPLTDKLSKLVDDSLEALTK
jgi:hypothetical protein